MAEEDDATDTQPDHDDLKVERATATHLESPWLALQGILSAEEGESLARAMYEFFPPWDATKFANATYDATANVLRLLEPLDGVRDGETIEINFTLPYRGQSPREND